MCRYSGGEATHCDPCRAASEAYASLSSALEQTDFRRLDERALDDWAFHLSVVYGKTLAADAWAELERVSVRGLAEHTRCVAGQAELVWYSGGAEHAEVIPFG